MLADDRLGGARGCQRLISTLEKHEHGDPAQEHAEKPLRVVRVRATPLSVQSSASRAASGLAVLARIKGHKRWVAYRVTHFATGGVVMADRLRVAIGFERREDGLVTVSVRTSRPLGPFVPYPGAKAVLPAQYVTRPETARVMAIGLPDVSGMRYALVRVSLPEAAGTVEHYFDLSEGSAERELVAAMIAQEVVPVVIAPDGFEVALTDLEYARVGWREALDAAQGISAAAWREGDRGSEMVFLSAFRPGPPRPRRVRRRAARVPKDLDLPFFAERSARSPARQSRRSTGCAYHQARRVRGRALPRTGLRGARREPRDARAVAGLALS